MAEVVTNEVSHYRPKSRAKSRAHLIRFDFSNSIKIRKAGRRRTSGSIVLDPAVDFHLPFQEPTLAIFKPVQVKEITHHRWLGLILSRPVRRRLRRTCRDILSVESNLAIR